MGLQWVFGPPGSGKTCHLYNQIIRESLEHPKRHFFVIVPEQFTLQTQKEIVDLHPRHGVLNIDIVSFKRLAFRVFSELSMECLPVLDDMGKSMVIRKVAAGEKQNLPLFAGHLDKPGFISELKSMLSELFQYGISAEQVGEMGEAAPTDLLKAKLRDLSALCRSFKDYIRDKCITTEEILDVLCRVLPESGLIPNSVIVLDGYTGFTPVQYRLLGLFLRHSREVRLSVTLDEAAYKRGCSSREDLFHMSGQMIKKVTELAKESGAPVHPDVCLFASGAYGYPAGERPALEFLGQKVFRYQQAKWRERDFGGDPSGGSRLEQELVLFQGMNPREEIRYAAGQILWLVREQGLHYRDIAVVTGDIAGYGMEIGRQFDRAQIPYFMDDKKNVLDHPMVELIRSALELIRQNFSYESVFRYLKCGMTGIASEDVCRMETYVRAMGIRGFKRWKEEWEEVCFSHPYLSLENLNECRSQWLQPVLHLKQAMDQPEAVVKDWIGGLRRFLEELDIEEKLEAYAASLTAGGQLRLAEEYGQVHGLVEDLFVRVEQLLGDEQVKKKEFAQILDAGFSEIRVGVIPVTLDRIVVGDITRSRLSHIKVLFFVGLNEGIVPAVKDGGGILTDPDRNFLESRGMELAPDSRAEGFMQRYYLYLVLTKPERKLYLTFSALDRGGRTRRPSSLVNEVRRLFPDLPVRHLNEKEPLYTAADGKRRLIRGLREGGKAQEEPDFLELYRWFYGKDEYRGMIVQLLNAVYYRYTEKGIGREAARRLYGEVLSGSVTRMEQYAACAYAHFLRYGLELKERKDYEIEAVDVGNLFHDSIERVFLNIRQQGENWLELTPDQRRELVSRQVREAAAGYGNTIFESSARYAYLTGKVEQMTERTIWALTHQLEKGDFEPSGFEVAFSGADHLESMEIPLDGKISLDGKEKLQLRGRIDRIDLYEEEGRLYVKIIDYKSGHTVFDLNSLYHGLQLQLAVYMSAAVELFQRKNPEKQVIPAGMFYYHIDDPMIDWENGLDQEEIQRRILKKLRMSGLVNSDFDAIRHLDREIEKESDVIPVAMKDGLVQEAKSSVASRRRLEALFAYVRETMAGQGREILDGSVSVRPYQQGNKKACDYCPYHGVCGFDLKTDGYGYRKFKACKPQEIWDKIVPKEEEDHREGGE